MAEHYRIVLDAPKSPMIGVVLRGFRLVDHDERRSIYVGSVRDAAELQSKLNQLADLRVGLLELSRTACTPEVPGAQPGGEGPCT